MHFFKFFFFDFLSYEGIYCAGGHFDPRTAPKVGRVNLGFFHLTLPTLGFLRVFDNNVAIEIQCGNRRLFMDHMNFFKYLYIINEEWGS